MLRSIYSSVLRLHPPFFRQRFAQEMLAIFDAEERSLSRIRLLADGILSLLRQWLLRPEFWTEPAQQPAPNGAPLFYLVKRFTPRFGALIDGGLVSIVTFIAVCLMMQYTWEHPTLMPIVSYYRASQRQAAQTPPPPARVQQKQEPIYVDGGRLILMVQGPSKR
jgi:hypothetical protein